MDFSCANAAPANPVITATTAPSRKRRVCTGGSSFPDQQLATHLISLVLTRLTDISLWAGLGRLVGASLFGRGFMELSQFGLHHLVVWLIDKHVHGGPAGACAGAVHQAAQVLFASLRG